MLEPNTDYEKYITDVMHLCGLEDRFAAMEYMLLWHSGLDSDLVKYLDKEMAKAIIGETTNV